MKHLILSATDGCYRTEHLLSLYVDGQLSKRQNEDVEKHLSMCASCKAGLVILQATRQILSNRSAVQPPAYLSERLRQAIAIEASRPAPAPRRSTWPATRLAIAGGAFAAVVVGAFLSLSQQTAPVTVGVKNPAPQKIAAQPPISSPYRTVPAPQKNLLASPAAHHHHAELVAEAPHTAVYTPSATRLSVPQPAVEPMRHVPLTAEHLAHPAAISRPTTPAVVEPSQSPVTSTTPGEPVIASAPPVISSAPATVAGMPAETPEVTQPAPEQPAPTVVAENPVQAHRTLSARLRVAQLDAASGEQSYVQPKNNELRVASYSPGLSIVGSDIH